MYILECHLALRFFPLLEFGFETFGAMEERDGKGAAQHGLHGLLSVGLLCSFTSHRTIIPHETQLMKSMNYTSASQPLPFPERPLSSRAHACGCIAALVAV